VTKKVVIGTVTTMASPLTVTSNVALVAAQIAARNCQGFLPRILLQAGKPRKN